MITCFAVPSHESKDTFTSVRSNTINAFTIILTWIRVAIVNVYKYIDNCKEVLSTIE